MKKVFLFWALLAVTVAACNTEQIKYGQGGRNACQYVKEQVPGLRDDIETIEVINEDSLLGDIGLTFDEVTLAKSGAEFSQGRISADKYRAIIDSISNDATDVYYSWKYSTVVNDSLKTLSKYDGKWRKVYTVRVTMKSGTTKEPRVLMDNDGVKPYMMERDMDKRIEDFTQKIIEAQRMLYF